MTEKKSIFYRNLWANAHGTYIPFQNVAKIFCSAKCSQHFGIYFSAFVPTCSRNSGLALYLRANARSFIARRNKLISILSLIFFVAIFRFVPHLPNATPLGYSAFHTAKKHGLFSGLLVPLLALFISDIFIGRYNPLLMTIVYGSFLIYPLFGYLRRMNIISLSAPLILVTASMFFFFTTNIGVFALSSWYPKTPLGLLICLLAGVPFFGSMLFGDMASLLVHRLFAHNINYIKNSILIKHHSVVY